MGPPIDPPNWFKRSGCCDSPLEAQSGSGASKKSLRKNSKRRPWKRLVPEGEVTFN